MSCEFLQRRATLHGRLFYNKRKRKGKAEKEPLIVFFFRNFGKCYKKKTR